MISKSPTVLSRNIKGKRLDYRLIHASNIMRPQLKFGDKLDNFAPFFIPSLRIKLHALISLEESLRWETVEKFNIDSETYQLRRGYPNPYVYEMMHLTYPNWLFDDETVREFRPLDQVSCRWVDRLDQLESLIDVLETQREIAVDLEHHNYRSYQGFVCLMQISTRKEDYLLDALSLRSHLHLLNRVFAHPQIVKVFHGADSDIVWLQRDFGVYVVNLFDTGQAARVLKMPNYSLAYLLNVYADVQADKRYQLADWRIRPLTDEMFLYAREDTHYLLYIFDRLRRELSKHPDLTKEVLHRSRNISIKTYDKEITNPEVSYLVLLRKYNKFFAVDQTAVLRALLGWRDRIAREEDESVRYILPNSMLVRLAESMPTEASKVIECCNPIPPLVRIHANDLALLIMKTRLELNRPKPDNDSDRLSNLVQHKSTIEETSNVISTNSMTRLDLAQDDMTIHVESTQIITFNEEIKPNQELPSRTPITIQNIPASSLFEIFNVGYQES